MDDTDILWRRTDIAGHDACRLERVDGGWCLSGAAVYKEGEVITSVAYRVLHDARWGTQSVRVSGWSGTKALSFEIERSTGGIWTCNGGEIADVEGCLDIDLGFTPATNTTAIRRLKLEVGAQKSGPAAWLDTADWALKPLEQSYARQAEDLYEYRSVAHNYRADLTTDKAGLVTIYPGAWVREI